MGMEINFRLEGEIGEYVAGMTDGNGWFADVEEYMRDLIRRDLEERRRAFEAYRAELQAAFAAPEEEAVEMTADEFLAEMRSRAA